MKKAFTLVELLVVVVVIAILASIAFKLGGLGSDSSRRTLTISRLQRLENCISGYFAAYGSYPPVDLQGRSRNFYNKVNESGIQQVEENPDTGVNLTSPDGWNRIQAACRAQPVAVRFPYRKDYHSYIKKVSDTLVENGKEDMVFDGLSNPERLSGKMQDGAWSNTQLFQFGLLSYLLPRYLVMMGYGVSENGSVDTEASKIYDNFVQWGDCNSMPSRFKDGLQYGSWADVNAVLGDDNEKWTIAALPSQSVTARWLPNLEGMLSGGASLGKLYGIQVCDNAIVSVMNPPCTSEIYSSGDTQSGANGGKSQPYILDKITCYDGWGQEFYYYSPPPYQSYRLWSSGANCRTFPPWVPDEEIDALKERNTLRNWLADDIVHMSN